MDCNKEEAIKAKTIAEKKMEGKDFTGARKLVLKAQRLFPDMENILQMLMVCDVHCAAEKRLYGNEMDWYGILQIEQSANEATIKKQYRKHALLLHPDKNKFIGAEAAFKLIGEAQRVLLDQEKRRVYDMKRKPAVVYRPPQRASPTFNVGVQTNFRSNFTSFNPQHQQPQQQGQSGFVNDRATFWTVCPFCSIRFQYFKEVVNRSLCCQNCKKPFVAYNMEVQGAQFATNLKQASFFQQQNSFNRGGHRVEVGGQGNSQSEKPRAGSCRRTQNSSEDASEKFSGKKRRKQASESSESCETGSSSEFEETTVTDEDGDSQSRKNVEHHPRRSSRNRQKVSYNENLSDDDEDFVIPPDKSKRNKSSRTLDEVNESENKEKASKINNRSGSADGSDDWREIKQEENECSEGNSLSRSKETKKVSRNEMSDEDDFHRSTESPGDIESESPFKETSQAGFFSCHDPDFNDFDMLRVRKCFAFGQIWAMYDDMDAMPRFYARIKKVFPSGFKVQITWLESRGNEGQSKCVAAKLPVSCGEYVLGSTEILNDCSSMFSHPVSWGEGNHRDSFKIYPRRGDIWALFKNWNRESSFQHVYEFVEILSDYTEEAGIDVALLGKVKGFSSLFYRMVDNGEKSFRVPADELFRFSHQVPSFRLTGDEREDVPRGSFELDPAALPANIPEIAIPKDIKEEAACTDPAVSSNTSKSTMGSNGDAATHKVDIENLPSGGHNVSAYAASSSEAFEIPEAEFCNFDDAERSHEKLQIGQIWALYSDEDGLPRRYVQIKKITLDPEFELKYSLLVSNALPSGTIRWHDEGMSISCGKFKGNPPKQWQSCTSTDSFSHVVRAVPATRNVYSISPLKGEVWALYRNWTPEIRCSDLEKCEYDIAEVIEHDDLLIEILFLERVNGFNSVFKARGKDVPTVRITIEELLRFSHRIPAFRLTDERDGNLRGFWELDPAAVPIHYFS